MAVRLVLCTAPDEPATRELVKTLVAERLVACGNIIRVNSIYRWQGAIEEAGEALIIFKTTDDAWPRLKERVAQLHPYDVPELLLIGLDDGHAPYLNWVEESTHPVSEV
jgi:periplasmic divalent cation tolerance protein